MKKVLWLLGGVIVLIIFVSIINSKINNLQQPTTNAPTTTPTFQNNKPSVKKITLKNNQTPTPPSAVVPPPTSPNIISLKTAELNCNTYSVKEATMQGIIFDLIPASYAPQLGTGDEILIEDAQDYSYKAEVFNLDPSVYQNLNLGDIVQVTGLLKSWSDGTSSGITHNSAINLDGNPVVVGHSSVVPSPATVLSETQSLIQAHQTDIENALQTASSSTSFDKCDQIDKTLTNDLCSTIGDGACLGSDSLPWAYKDSNTLITNEIETVFNACLQKFPL
jgi:hypothetical protein